jgi:transcriptional regulator
MYTPQAFQIDDPEKIAAFVEQNGFGILITTHEEEIESTHTPMFLSPDRKQVYGHIAKANAQWKYWSACPQAKLIFHGAHTYISPTDYLSSPSVPTWNYTAVSIRGRIEVLASIEQRQRVVEHLAETYESGRELPWRLDTDDGKLMSLLDGIVCFSVRVESIQAKFKLSQNKSREDQRQVIKQLRTRGGDMNAEIADLMEAQLEASES